MTQQIEITGAGYKPQGDFLIAGKKINPVENKELELLLQIASLCNNTSFKLKVNEDDKELKTAGDYQWQKYIMTEIK